MDNIKSIFIVKKRKENKNFWWSLWRREVIGFYFVNYKL